MLIVVVLPPIDLIDHKDWTKWRRDGKSLRWDPK
jgi:hypothetical protein